MNLLRRLALKPRRVALAGLLLAMAGGVFAAGQPGEWQLALPGFEYHFPADHAVHRDYKTEWWYFTGNLRDTSGHAYGYELTFFRQGVVPPGRRPASEAERSRFIQDDFKFAHFAISDLDGRRFYCVQKTSRGAFGEAGFGPAPAQGAAAAQGEPRLVWLDDWRVTPLPDGSWEIVAKAAAPVPMAIQLRVDPAKPPVIEGVDGVSQKAAGAGNASHYYSFTRLKTTGTLRVAGTAGSSARVDGESWFDHEWASNQLAPDQIGWDWFCFQFDDNTELMLYLMRRRDGSIDPVSSGTFVDANGGTEHLPREAFQLLPLETWHSAVTGATYPVAWQVSIPAHQLEMTVRARLREQELVVPPISYWEGAVRASGKRAGQPLAAEGYMELTGYTGELVGLKKADGDGRAAR